MARFEHETTIKATPQEVFEYVSDMTRHGEWGSHDLTVTKTSAGDVGKGATFSSVSKQFGTQKETQTVVDYDPGKRFAFESKGALGMTLNAFDISEADGGSRLVKSVELTKPSFLAKVMGFRIRKDAPKSMAEDCARIKAKLEG